MSKARYPKTNWGWHRYYVNRFEKTGSPDAEYLAMLYFLFHTAFGDSLIPA